MKSWTVVKLGGSLLENVAMRSRALAAISAATASGENLVVVHGGGKRIDATLAKLGIPKRTHAGLRITDDATLDVVVSVLSGTVNKLLVAELTSLGTPSAGISGPDAATLEAEPHPPIDGVELGHVGRVTSANPALIEAIAARGVLPVVASVALGPDSTMLNVNADAAAAAIAVALGAKRLLFLTDVPGLLDDKGQVIESISAACAEQLLEYRVVSGGIVPKLRSCLEAIHGGVGEVVIAGPAGHENALNVGMGGTRLVAA
ncbi:MAG: acetylglutamate kinase [Acidobacteria bacterium]|nr:acetylglutamate kinase [Acidobacteriota bacterium]